MSSDEDLFERRKRLRFRSQHRGTKEMDLILGAFAEHHLVAFDAAEMDEYEKLLELDDSDLWSWVVGRAPVAVAHSSTIMDLFVNFKYTTHPTDK
jgi:antitoxin CptB